MDLVGWIEYSRFFWGLGFVFIILAAGVWLFQRFNMAQRKKNGFVGQEVEILTTLTIDPKRRLITVKFGYQEHFILLVMTDQLIASQPFINHIKPARIEPS